MSQECQIEKYTAAELAVRQVLENASLGLFATGMLELEYVVKPNLKTWSGKERDNWITTVINHTNQQSICESFQALFVALKPCINKYFADESMDGVEKKELIGLIFLLKRMECAIAWSSVDVSFRKTRNDWIAMLNKSTAMINILKEEEEEKEEKEQEKQEKEEENEVGMLRRLMNGLGIGKTSVE